MVKNWTVKEHPTNDNPISQISILFWKHFYYYTQFLQSVEVVQKMASPSGETTHVPFFVLHLSEGKAKALFTVPTSMANSLIINPVLCRGSSFDLEIDVVSQGRKRASSTTSFLSTEFYSPDPEETALAISQRLAVRIGNPSSLLTSSSLLGLRWKPTYDLFKAR